jgi:hypothetical protein
VPGVHELSAFKAALELSTVVFMDPRHKAGESEDLNSLEVPHRTMTD